MKPRFALAVPHTPWRPERVASYDRLLRGLQIAEHETDCHGQYALADGWCSFYPQLTAFRTFQDRAPNREWAMAMWRWGDKEATLGDATHLLQLQDDVIPCDDFWPILSAMVEANPERVIGLQSQHPTGRSLAHMGRRWYRTQAWLVGPQYVLPLKGPDSIHEMLAWLDAHPEAVEKSIGEDVTISAWLRSTGRDVWHPIPAIADVDLTLPSTYEGNDEHDHRSPTVTWHGYNPAQLSDPSYWAPQDVPLLPGPGLGLCTFCGNATGFVRVPNGSTMCKQCAANVISHLINKA